MNTRKMPKAYSYIRFSTAIQAEGDSFRRQTELSAQYAAKHDLFLDTSLTLFDEGLSGFTGANRTKGALAIFLHAVESGLVEAGSYLLVESLDRLSRDTISEQMTLFMSLINNDIIVVTLTDGQVYSKNTINTDISRLMMSLVIMMRAHEESLMKSKRLKAVWENKRKTVREKKLTGQCPAWLSLNADRKSFSIIKERAAVVRRIYAMSVAGTGHQSIAKTLNGEGIPSWGDRGKKFVAADICDLASFVGELRNRKNPVSEYLWKRFSESSRQLLGSFTADAPPRPLTDSLVREFGDIIKGCLIYDSKRFESVQLSAQSQYLIRAIDQNRDDARLNRLLIEDAYPKCIRRRYTGWQFSYVRALLRTRAVLGEYQPHRRERGLKRRSIPAGDPVKDYYPAVIDLSTWQRAQLRKKTSTPGRLGTQVSNIFGGLIFDGYTNAPMRFVSKRPRPDAQGVRNGRWRYLVSDYARMQKGAKAATWRYEWFEQWFLDYMIRLDWSAIAKEEAPAEELATQRRLAEQRATHEEIERSIDRLMDLAKTSSKPPASLLDELAKLDEQKLESENVLQKLEREAEAIADQRNALNDSGDRMKALVTSGDIGSRLRLREEVRRKVRRIDIFPSGAPDNRLTDYPVSLPGWPCFQLTFVNGATRWVFCEDKNPEGHQIDHAPVLDTNIPPELLADYEPAQNEAAAELQITTVGNDGKPLSRVRVEAIRKRAEESAKNLRQPQAQMAQLDMVLHEKPQGRIRR